MVYKSERKKKIQRNALEKEWSAIIGNLYLWEEKELNHYLRMQDYNISRI